MKKNSIYKIFLLPVVTLAFMAGCITEDITPGDVTDFGDEVELTFNYSISGMQTVVKTRMSEDEENTIYDALIIVYKLHDDGVERYDYTRGVVLGDQNGATGSFKARLAKSEGSEKYTYDILFNTRYANGMEYIVSALGLQRGVTTRDEVRNAAHCDMNTQQWGSMNFPMWAGIKKEEAFDIDLFTTIPPLNIIRFTARVDVGLNLDDNDVSQGLANFKLKTAGAALTAEQAGYIPHPDNVTSDGKITAASLDYVEHHTDTSHGTTSWSATNDAVIAKLYIAEQDGNFISTYAGGSRRFTLFIQGDYTDKEGKTATYFYPIRLPDPNDPDKYLDIIRNHKYRINIKAITGPGYATAAIAVERDPINVIYDLSVHSVGRINHIVYNGQNFLGVSEVHCTVSGEVNTSQTAPGIYVTTNTPGGWSAVLTDENGATPATTTIRLGTIRNSTLNSISETKIMIGTANTGDPEVYYATFTAGPLSIVVTILKNGTWYIETDYPPGTIMNGDGAEYSVCVWGYVPKVWVRAYSPDIVNIKYESDPSYKPDPSTGVSRDTIAFAAGIYEQYDELDWLEILGNAWVPNRQRQVQFQYTLTDPFNNNNVEWIPFEEGPQGKGHFRLQSSGRIVSLYDYQSGGDEQFSWAQAMGIDTYWDYNGTSSWSPPFYHTTYTLPHTFSWNKPVGEVSLVSGSNRNNLYYPPDQGFETGCVDYEEEGYENVFPKGKWRLPSLQELFEMNNFREHIGDLASEGDGYWSSTDQNTSAQLPGAYQVFINPDPNWVWSEEQPLEWFGISGRGDERARVRCVYDDPSRDVIQEQYETWFFRPNKGPVF